jgi:SAM-dependent methyltransferase
MAAFLGTSLETNGTSDRPAGSPSSPSQARISSHGGNCPVCGSHEWNYTMNAHGLTFFTCDNCQLMRLYPEPSAKTVEAIRQNQPAGSEESTEEEFERARAYWMHLHVLLGSNALKMKVLLLSSEEELLLRAGRAMGFRQIEVLAADGSPPLIPADGSFDACLAVFAIERMANPLEGLRQIHGLLKTDGKLVIVTPLIDSWPARICRDAWTQLRPENRFYFSIENLQTALLNHGFHRIWVRPDRRRYSLSQLHRHAGTYPSTRLTRLVRAGCRLAPLTWRNRVRLPLPTSAFVITATKMQPPARRKLSIIMPVYNEKATFAECFQAVRAKELDGIEKEIIVVESNSTDGTRELVQKLCVGDGVHLILQERAAGKGNAVRAGLKAVAGDIILIQDADLEYDVNDYDGLLKPILQRNAALVLGSRHIGSWKLRKFNDQPFVATFFNLGHLFFCTSLNLLYRQSLKDPFTMYKVFRTDCLHGLDLECDRFDFDFEILIKLVRKGYKVVELPVNYRARSLTDGKKVTVVRDPLTWVRALIKYRFCKIGPPRELVTTSPRARAGRGS